jgi:DNA-binding transcriptional regulator YiaG
MKSYKNTSWDVNLNTQEVQQLTEQLRIGNNIAHIRKYRGLSQSELAKRA